MRALRWFNPWYWWLRFDLWNWNATIAGEEQRYREFHSRLASYVYSRQRVMDQLRRYR